MTIPSLSMQGAALRMPARFSLSAIAVATMLGQAAVAKENTHQETIVTATRIPQALSQVTADISIITAQEIEQAGPVGVADILARAPGVQLSRNGGVGQTTGVYIRGTSNQHAVVLIDGVRYSTQETQGGALWANLPLAQIERIEILRGPAAAVYGSDAIGGVIQIFTRKAHPEKSNKYIEVGAGTHQTYKTAAGISSTVNDWNYALTVTDQRSDGFDAYPGNTWDANPDRDGYINSSLGFNLGYTQGIHRLDAGLNYTRMKGQYDQSTPPFDDYDTSKTTIAHLKWGAQWGANYRSEVQVSRTHLNTDRQTSAPESLKANSTSLVWQNIWSLQGYKVSVNFEHIEDRLNTDYAWTQNVDEKRTQNALALGWNYNLGSHSFNAHVRHDDVRNQKSKTTGSLGYGLQINDKWRWTASAGTAFRTPTLYERFTGQSAADLRPENSRNLETGLYFENGDHKLSAVVYRNKIRDQITYDWTSAQPCYCYRNWEKVELTGLTLSGSTRLAQWNLGASFDFLNPKDLERNTLLPYRSKRTVKLYADTKLSDWVFGGEAQLYSQRQTNATNTKQLPGYGIFNLYAEHAFAKDFSLLARLDNVGDKKFQPVDGYANAGRTVFVGLKWAPK